MWLKQYRLTCDLMPWRPCVANTVWHAWRCSARCCVRISLQAAILTSSPHSMGMNLVRSAGPIRDREKRKVIMIGFYNQERLG